MTEQDYLKLWQQVTSKPLTNREVAFAALVAAAERERFAWTQEHWTEYERNIAAASKAEEREAIAQMIEDAPPLVDYAINDRGGCLVCGFTPKLASEFIRARGQTK